MRISITLDRRRALSETKAIHPKLTKKKGFKRKSLRNEKKPDAININKIKLNETKKKKRRNSNSDITLGHK